VTGDELAQQLRHDGRIAEKPVVERVVVGLGRGHYDPGVSGTVTHKQESSFLKKRSKRLLDPVARLSGRRTPGCKSFLVLFFKKERLALRSRRRRGILPR
jgi:hypothetical protein